jgi:hypothetical protein
MQKSQLLNEPGFLFLPLEFNTVRNCYSSKIKHFQVTGVTLKGDPSYGNSRCFSAYSLRAGESGEGFQLARLSSLNFYTVLRNHRSSPGPDVGMALRHSANPFAARNRTAKFDPSQSWQKRSDLNPRTVAKLPARGHYS